MKIQLVHVFLFFFSIVGAVLTWGWFGPFAGMLWSGACLTFGIMIGMTLRNDNSAERSRHKEELVNE